MLAAGEKAGQTHAAAAKTDDEFLLTPLEEVGDMERFGKQFAGDRAGDRGRGSGVGAGSGVSMAAMLDEDLSASRRWKWASAGRWPARPCWAASRAHWPKGPRWPSPPPRC